MTDMLPIIVLGGLACLIKAAFSHEGKDPPADIPIEDKPTRIINDVIVTPELESEIGREIEHYDFIEQWLDDRIRRDGTDHEFGHACQVVKNEIEARRDGLLKFLEGGDPQADPQEY